MNQRNGWKDGILGESQLILQIIYRLRSLWQGVIYLATSQDVCESSARLTVASRGQKSLKQKKQKIFCISGAIQRIIISLSNEKLILLVLAGVWWLLTLPSQTGKLINNSLTFGVEYSWLNRDLHFLLMLISHLQSLYITPRCHFKIHHFRVKIRSMRSTVTMLRRLRQEV